MEAAYDGRQIVGMDLRRRRPVLVRMTEDGTRPGGCIPLVWVRPTLSARVVTVAFTAALSLIGALAATQNFLGNFNNFLLLVLYLFVPWTAVNLVGTTSSAGATMRSPRSSTLTACTGAGGGAASSPTPSALPP